MADLDNFFAKKDKKRKGKKYTSKTTQIPNEQLSSQSTASSENTPNKELKIDHPNTQSKDEEWIEEKETVEDLDGLKVARLNLDTEETTSERKNLSNEGDMNDDQLDGGNPKQAISAWQTAGGQLTESEESSEEEDEDNEKELTVQKTAVETSEPSTAIYVPPYMRSRASGGSGSSGFIRSNRKPTAPPDIQSSQAFPSLKASLESADRNQSDKDFIPVKNYKKGVY